VRSEGLAMPQNNVEWKQWGAEEAEVEEVREREAWEVGTEERSIRVGQSLSLNRSPNRAGSLRLAKRTIWLIGLSNTIEQWPYEQSDIRSLRSNLY
jgi:hypothetical protein